MNKVIKTDNAPSPIGPYSQAVVAGGIVYVAGQGPANPKTRTIDETTVAGQTRQVMENIKAILDAAGSSMDKIVKTQVLLADIDDFAEFNAVYAEYFTGDAPARMTSEAGKLIGGILVEIDAIASL